MSRQGDGADGPDGRPGSRGEPYRIAVVGLPSAPGLIGLAPCPGVRQKRFRPDLLGDDLEEIECWGVTAVVGLIREEQAEALSLGRLTHEIRRRGIGCVFLQAAAGRLLDPGFERQWERVRSRLAQALRQGERLLITCTGEGRRIAIVAGWLMIETGVAAEQALATIRAARPDALATEEEAESVESYVRRG